MSDLLIKFEIRIRDRSSLADLGAQVAQALNIQLKPSHSRRFQESEGLEGEAIGVDVSLHYWPPLAEGELRTYRLIGYSASDVKLPWDEAVDLSPFVLRVMNRRHDPGWFIPSEEERYADLDAD